MSEGNPFTVQLTNPMLYDRLHTLAMEYDLPAELLVNVAVKRLVEDVDFVRSLRIGKAEGMRAQNQEERSSATLPPG